MGSTTKTAAEAEGIIRDRIGAAAWEKFVAVNGDLTDYPNASVEWLVDLLSAAILNEPV
nr:hypothetical protein Ade03nite_34900 [Actinoplanes derwentensis]